MKQKNPLYLVKGKTILPTQNIFEYVVERFNLKPLLQVIQNLMNFILEQVRDYPTFLMAKNFMDEISMSLNMLKKRFSL